MRSAPDNSKLHDFFQAYPVRIYKKGEVLIQAGETPPAYYISKGVVLQYDISHSGDKLVLNMYKPGACIYIASILNNIPAELYFEAADYVTVHEAPAEDVLQFLQENPAVVYDALARISRGSIGLMHRLARAMEGSAEGRILQELHIMQSRFSTDGTIRISDTELAAQTGMARETVSRSLKKLDAKGLIKASRGTITLLNIHHI